MKERINFPKMLKKSALICLLFVNNFLYGQDMFTYCGHKKLQYENGNKNHFSLVLHTPYKEYSDINIMPKDIIEKNKNYLLMRAGSDFLKQKAKFVSCYVINFSDNKDHKNREWLAVADKNVKYAFEYYFNIQKGMKYYFTTVYDSIGNLLSQPMLPSINSNQDFDKIIGVCNAKAIAEKDTVFKGKVINISLQYLDSINSFTWNAELPEIKTRKNGIALKRAIIINANTGIIIKREEREIYSVCDGNTPPMPKLK